MHYSTSGTTGNPKGALLTHSNFISGMASSVAMGAVTTGPDDVYLSYLPLPHIFERMVQVGGWVGGTTPKEEAYFRDCPCSGMAVVIFSGFWYFVSIFFAVSFFRLSLFLRCRVKEIPLIPLPYLHGRVPAYCLFIVLYFCCCFVFSYSLFLRCRVDSRHPAACYLLTCFWPQPNCRACFVSR